MFLATRITASIQAFIVLIFVCSVCLSPQISEPILTQDQLPPPPLDVPTFLTLAQTLTQTSFGLQQDAFQDWLEANPMDDSMRTLRTFILSFQAAVIKDIDRLNATLQQEEALPYFLSDNLKYSVLPSNSFEQHLIKCGQLQGFLPYGMHLLDNIIDQTNIPSPMYISQQPIFKSLNPSRWQQITSNSASLCAVWQISEITNQAEITSQTDCNQKLQALCLQSVGSRTYSNHVERQTTKQQLLLTNQHLYYLITQLLTYPYPERRFASDISVHLTNAFEFFQKYIENNDKLSYQALLASRHCIDLTQLALQKAQHSEGWKAEERQQSNFEAIQKLINHHTSSISNMESRFQNLEAIQRQSERLRKDDITHDRSPAKGSGPADRPADRNAQSQQPQHDDRNNNNDDGVATESSNNNDDDVNDDSNNNDDDVNDDGAASTAGAASATSRPSTISTTSEPSTTREPSTTSEASTTTKPSTTNGANASNANNLDDDDDGNANDNDDTASMNSTETWSSVFSWQFWFPQNRNYTESSQNQNFGGDLQLSHPNGNQSFPFDIYSSWEMVYFWPFTKLFSLAAFHLFNVIDFYINLLWKLFTVILAVYVFTLNQRVSRLEIKCDSLNQNIQITQNIKQKRPIDPDELKEGVKRQAEHRNRQQNLVSDPQSAQCLLPQNR